MFSINLLYLDQNEKVVGRKEELRRECIKRRKEGRIEKLADFLQGSPSPRNPLARPEVERSAADRRRTSDGLLGSVRTRPLPC